MTPGWEQIRAFYRAMFATEIVGQWEQECPLCPAITQGGLAGLEAHLYVCHPDQVLDGGPGCISN